jgi:hypothetical protein
LRKTGCSGGKEDCEGENQAAHARERNP